jgi:hypothetical protein
MVLNLRMLWKDSFIQKIRDDRNECFDEHFPCRSESCNRDSMLPIDQNVYSVLTYENIQN